MTTRDSLFSYAPNVVKSKLLDGLRPQIDRLFESAQAGASERELELDVWRVLLELGRLLLATLFALQARRATERDLHARGLDISKVSFRLDRDYWYTSTTTLGPVGFPLFAYRDRHSAVGVTTRAPARRLFPLHQHCRSSQLCLEWEARLGSEHPFRAAQQALTFFTHGAVSLEDTTIASHMVTAGSVVDWHWLYRPVEEIREILRTRATWDVETGRPIIYASSDAHALRRYVDGTWNAAWKMANGLRLWCVDRRTGAIVHLGGEYTWGDCNEVERIVRRLIESGHLPANGDYGDDVVARVAWITDGMPWFEEHILKLFPDALVILDAYHALDHLGKFAAAVWGKGHSKARRFYNQARNALFGTRRVCKAKPKVRKGHTKRRKAMKMAYKRKLESRRNRKPTTKAEPLLNVLRRVTVPCDKAEELEGILRYITNNAYRMDYARYIQLGYQIGSGAMESLHRVASQLRIKRPGPGWLPETAQAVFNLRMLTLVGRWDEFWSQPDLTDRLVTAFQAASERGAV